MYCRYGLHSYGHRYGISTFISTSKAVGATLQYPDQCCSRAAASGLYNYALYNCATAASGMYIVIPRLPVLQLSARRRNTRRYIVIAYIVMIYVVMTYIVMVYIVMTYRVVACI